LAPESPILGDAADGLIMHIHGSHSTPLVALSILIAICASYTALSLSGRVAVARGRGRVAWLLGGSIAMGSGIWSMHFVAMLAFSLPGLTISYDVPLVTVSHLAAVGASAFALLVASRPTVSHLRLIVAGQCLGLAIVTMHYTGMASVRVPASLDYDPMLVAASVVIAVGASTVALWLFIWLRNEYSMRGQLLRASAAVVMGLAIAGMHYTGMAAARFTPSSDPALATSNYSLDTKDLEVPVVIGAFVILALTLIASITDHWVRAKIAAADAQRESEERARQAAEAANFAKSEFLSRMSHELRTPLNAILGFGQLMELEADTPERKENADHVLKAGRHLLSLINEVLDITGIEAGNLPLSSEPLLVREIAAEVLSLMGPLAASRRISLSCDLPESPALFVQGDRQRLKQVLLNLTANAVKYNREGGTVTIWCERQESGRIRTYVVDTGPGIAPDKLTRLFTPFDRLGAAQSVEGTGLGLAVSKRLAEAMGGTMGVNSEVGSGSRFWIELPAAASPLDALTEDSPAPAVPLTDGARGKRKVLYVEDNLPNLALMQRVLGRREDIELISAMTGGIALDLLRQHHPDMVLLDLHRPDMTGDDVLAYLKRDPHLRDIPVVILSADATPAHIARLLAAGAREYLTKPLELQRLFAVLTAVLDIKEAA
jgi:signal transduction histidine kinase/ActR/RegA family two-component response regulator